MQRSNNVWDAATGRTGYSVSSLGRQCLLWDHTGASLRLLLCVKEQREVWLLPVGRWGQRG